MCQNSRLVARRAAPVISAGRPDHPSGPKVGGGGLPPQLFKPRRVGGGVADGVLDVAVAEVVLDQPGVRALVGQGVAAGVAQHVRIGGQGQPGPLAALAAPRLRLRPGRPGGGHPADPGLPRPPQHPAHRPLHRRPPGAV